MRILIDEEELSVDQAFEITYKTFSYTNHTVLPEALEKWTVELIQNLLPRHMELIYLINHFWMIKVAKRFPDDCEKMRDLSIIEEGDVQKVKMANLSIVCSHVVNGVAQIHSDLIKSNLFFNFNLIFPTKF